MRVFQPVLERTVTRLGSRLVKQVENNNYIPISCIKEESGASVPEARIVERTPGAIRSDMAMEE